MIKKWKKLSSKQVFSHPRHDVFIDVVELPNGEKTEYLHFGSGKDAAMVIGLRTDGKFLLQKEYSYPPDEVLFQFPGGLIETGETPEDGALREFEEEAKFTGTLSSLGFMYIQNRRSSNKMYFFLATDLKPAKQTADPEEFFEDFWLTEAEIDELIRTNEIKNYTALAGWAFYKAKK
jgi:ADP-ribose pyrophosphatase